MKSTPAQCRLGFHQQDWPVRVFATVGVGAELVGEEPQRCRAVCRGGFHHRDVTADQRLTLRYDPPVPRRLHARQIG